MTVQEFEAFIKSGAPKAICYNIAKNQADACDLEQATLCRLYERLHLVDRPVYGLFKVMARNAWLDSRRQSFYKKRVAIEEAENWPCPRSTQPENILAGKESGQAIEKAMNRLCPDSQAVVVSCLFDGQDLKDAAASMRIPEGTVKSRLYRALPKLRQALAKQA